jgi:glycosyltransferase involved in cell wall biosynthesis
LRRSLRAGLEQLLGVQIGVLNTHAPRPLVVPEHYTHSAGRTSDLTFSIVTPSYNQGQFLEQTIRSVLQQSYPHLEYIVQDGGSTDDTPQILARYQDRLTHCESRRDRGQAHAINLGFEHATGDVLAFLNSDDRLLPGALHYVADYFDRHQDVDVVYGHRVLIDEDDAEVNRWVLPPHDGTVLSWFDPVPQETLFWRRSLWERAGAAMDESFRFALDWDLLLRFRESGARFARLPRFLGAFRLHSRQKTSAWMESVGNHEMDRLVRRCQGRAVSSGERYRHIFPYLFRHSLYQRLYRLGVLRH